MQIIRDVPAAAPAKKPDEIKHVLIEVPGVRGIVCDDGKYYAAHDGVIRIPEDQVEAVKKQLAADEQKPAAAAGTADSAA